MTVLQTYFQHRLEDMGYRSELDVHYSLSYSQGDGIAFYGTLEGNDLDKLISRFAGVESSDMPIYQRLRSRQRGGLIKQFLEVYQNWDTADLTIARIGSHHYNHFNSMELSHDAKTVGELIEEFEDEDAFDGTLRALKHGEPLWEQFMEWLEEDIKTTSRLLEREGYAISEAGTSEARTVWERTTTNVRFRAQLCGDLDAMDNWDPSLSIDTLGYFARGEGCIYSLTVTAFCRHTGSLLNSVSLGGIHSDTSLSETNGRTAGYLADLVYEVIQALRSDLTQTLAA